MSTLIKSRKADPGEAEDKSYWAARYNSEAEVKRMVENYQVGFDRIRPFVLKFCSPKQPLLVLGCNHSRLADELHLAGYKSVTCVDNAQQCVTSRLKAGRGLDEYGAVHLLHVDARKLVFPDQSFNAIIDRGQLDTLDFLPRAESDQSRVLSEVHRVLRPGGMFVLMTQVDPANRMEVRSSGPSPPRSAPSPRAHFARAALPCRPPWSPQRPRLMIWPCVNGVDTDAVRTHACLSSATYEPGV
jgi:SAM-dependent methyltransferase